MFVSTRCLEALRNTCQYPWHLHAFLGPTVTLSCKHSCSSDTKIFSPWWQSKTFHLISNLVFSAEESLGIVPFLLPPCPLAFSSYHSLPWHPTRIKTKVKGIKKKESCSSRAIFVPNVWLAASFCHRHFCGHLRDSPVVFFQLQLLRHGWIELAVFSVCFFFSNWTGFFPQPCSSSPFLCTDSQLEAIISSI